MEVDLLQECEIEPHDLIWQLVPQISLGLRRDLLQVADAPEDVPGTLSPGSQPI